MLAIIDSIGWHTFNVISITSTMGYIAVVVLGYVTEGPHYPMTFDVYYPIRSAVRILVGIGVRVIAIFLRVASALVAPLIEASAQVGEWIIQRCSAEIQARYRSRFI